MRAQDIAVEAAPDREEDNLQENLRTTRSMLHH